MRNKWYGDKRDLVKWSVLIHLAKMNNAKRILQVAYFRSNQFDGVEIDRVKFETPPEITNHFRNIHRIEELSSPVKVSVFNTVFNDRKGYLDQAKEFIASFSHERCIVFLDPDTGLEPETVKSNLDHVLNSEIKELWDALKPDDVLALYQHQTNRNGKTWIEPKKGQFTRAIGAAVDAVKIGHGDLARDVVVFYVQKV